MTSAVVDAHVHFWEPRLLDYPWLDARPALRRPCLPPEYAAAAAAAPVEKILFVECNARPAQHLEEVELAEQLARMEPRIAGIVAFVDLRDAGRRARTLDALGRSPLVKGVRQNIQGEPAGFALDPAFVAGVRAVGERGLAFDLCATHDQLGEVAALVARCPGTRLVLDHCGKPPIRAAHFDRWARALDEVARHANVVCKLSGLLSEAGPGWTEGALEPYASEALAVFGDRRLMYGSDWPLVDDAGSWEAWYRFTARFTSEWPEASRSAFYHDTAVEVYRL
ncbi:MAG TPA: amidohydrolase family protein [Gemmatimonadaceae bacterium]|nr:amidohydrolase family protein [Gemmatimonadaceae bacterium]